MVRVRERSKTYPPGIACSIAPDSPPKTLAWAIQHLDSRGDRFLSVTYLLAHLPRDFETLASWANDLRTTSSTQQSSPSGLAAAPHQNGEKKESGNTSSPNGNGGTTSPVLVPLIRPAAIGPDPSPSLKSASHTHFLSKNEWRRNFDLLTKDGGRGEMNELLLRLGALHADGGGAGVPFGPLHLYVLGNMRKTIDFAAKLQEGQFEVEGRRIEVDSDMGGEED